MRFRAVLLVAALLAVAAAIATLIVEVLWTGETDRPEVPGASTDNETVRTGQSADGATAPEDGPPRLGPLPVSPPPPVAAESESEVKGHDFTLTKPNVAGWRIAEPDFDGPRTMLAYELMPENEGGKPYGIARAYFSVVDGDKFPLLTDPKAVVAWAKNEHLSKELRTDGRPLDESEVTFGGIVWTVVKGRGEGTQSKRTWGVIERRFYVAKVGGDVVYIDAWIRLGAEPDAIWTFWNAVESTFIRRK